MLSNVCWLADGFGCVIVASARVGWESPEVITRSIEGERRLGMVELKPRAAFLLRLVIGLNELVVKPPVIWLCGAYLIHYPTCISSSDDLLHPGKLHKCTHWVCLLKWKFQV